ncbi:hypothetical protein [Polaribacter uvawellassae]|uniref:hypothetical protein n=1 Tax=Polaribacter uvawellassae TaxID=3133495 RepID=UPI00321AD221
MKKINLYFYFYKNKFAFPLALSLFILFSLRAMPLAVLTLAATTFLIWFYQKFINDQKNQTLYFYYNLGITELKLYTFLFFINMIVLISINISIKWML